MEAIKGYLLSVTAAALVCGMVTALGGKSSGISKLLKLLCGLFLAATVVKPLVDVKIGDIWDFAENLTVSSDAAVAMGENVAAEEMEGIIKQKTQTYILDKAKALGADVTVEVSLEGYIPSSVTVIGDLSPYVKSNLSASIARELNIPPEEQVWIRY